MMNFNQFDTPPKELMSDSLQDAFEPDNKANLSDQLIMVALIINKDYFFSGSLLGIEISDNPRLDIKILISKGFEFIKNIALAKEQVHSLMVTLGDDATLVSGPFSVSSVKIIETDYENRTCVLAVDLLKVQP